MNREAAKAVCIDCGYERKEHSYNGACYGLCGKFREAAKASDLGPCIICGDIGYNLSCGGPSICPKCDCGSFDGATVEKQAKVISDLRAQLSAAEARQDEWTIHAGKLKCQLETAKKAMELARKRIEYYGGIGHRRHFDHDLAEIFPRIDAVLHPTGDKQ